MKEKSVRRRENPIRVLAQLDDYEMDAKAGVGNHEEGRSLQIARRSIKCKGHKVQPCENLFRKIINGWKDVSNGQNLHKAIYMKKTMSNKDESKAHTIEDERKIIEQSVVRTYMKNSRTHNTSSGKTLARPARRGALPSKIALRLIPAGNSK
ncbi:hypothetical protein F511_12974 [Dorcoceras hygrometricum]|uniref:Uncharacterized protein n=1 Tax=Dorcoceras hygrometricum TaxID=472368 RepID=A0A2Z7BGQ8_9LAMI|nr:hypothetical protein F511_12974 [Dorcoceras hygrometricum]